jgi:hypothetical protein
MRCNSVATGGITPAGHGARETHDGDAAAPTALWLSVSFGYASSRNCGGDIDIQHEGINASAFSFAAIFAGAIMFR